MAYPNVTIRNSTNYQASGTVVYESIFYESIFCSSDNYSVGPTGTWTASSRGVCLVTNISAVLNDNGQQITATPYSSSGTSYSTFEIVQTGSNPDTFQVTRLTGDSDDIDVGEVDPAATETQK